MKIGVLTTPWLKVPPHGYGGRELVVYDEVEGLVKKGHDVTLFATGDCKTPAKLAYFYPRALGNDAGLKQDPYLLLNHVYAFFKLAQKEKFDIIHNHISLLPFYFADQVKSPLVSTLHGTLNRKDLQGKAAYGGVGLSVQKVLLQFKNYPFISISKKQREGLPELHYVATIYNGIRPDEFEFNPNGGKDMVWIGRVAPAKGIDVGIKLAEATKKKIHLGYWIDAGDREYFQEKVEPHKKNPYVVFHREIVGNSEKSAFLGNAKLFLFPIQWDEPFGIVMAEAMSTGTPIVAYARGSVPEVIRDGVTGFLVNPSVSDKRGNFIIKKTGEEGMQEAIKRIYAMKEEEYLAMRKAAREHVKKQFSVEKMVDKYEKVFEKLLEKHKKKKA